MRELILTKGYKALVDDDDYYWVSQFNWMAIVLDGVVYARRNKKKGVLKGNEPYEMYLHRVVMRCTDKSKVVDHKDHDGLNCQKDNLRICTSEENKRNVRSHKGSFSKYLGVCYDKSRGLWSTQLTVEGLKIEIGRFPTEILAAEAFDIAVLEHSKGFGNMNFPSKVYNKTLTQIREENKRPFKISNEHKLTLLESRSHIDYTKLHREKRGKKVINTLTGITYGSLAEVSEIIGMSKGSLSRILLGKRKNKTTYKYL